jgi:dTDP-L-rhamnose 4-epimerase
VKNVLVTGGAGFIGSNLTLILKKKGYNVTVLDNLSPLIHGSAGSSTLYSSIKGQVNFIKGDVRKRGDWIKALVGQDAIIHLAAETGTGQSMYLIEKYVDVNVKGTGIMLDILTNNEASNNVQKVIVASSRAIYGEGKYDCINCGVVYPEARTDLAMQDGDFECKCPTCQGEVKLLSTDEESKIHPTSIYGITKQNQEQMVYTTCKALGIPSVVYRYQNVYGPGQSLINPYTGIISIFSALIKSGKDVNIFEDGKDSRDFVYIDDVVNATIAGLERNAANNQAFCIGSDKPIDVLTVAEILCQKYASQVKLNVSGNYRIGDIRHNYANITKAKQLLEYCPKFDFETGIGIFTEWVNGQSIKDINFNKSLDELKSKGLLK